MQIFILRRWCWILRCVGIQVGKGRQQASEFCLMLPAVHFAVNPWGSSLCAACMAAAVSLAFGTGWRGSFLPSWALRFNTAFQKNENHATCYYMCVFVLLFLSFCFRSTANSQKLRKGSWKSVLYFQSVAVLLVRNWQDLTWFKSIKCITSANSLAVYSVRVNFVYLIYIIYITPVLKKIK